MSSSNEGGGNAAMGCLMLPVVILVAPFAVAFATCMFPVAGLLTLATAVIVAVITTQQNRPTTTGSFALV